jgi:hypothetical protein
MIVGMKKEVITMIQYGIILLLIIQFYRNFGRKQLKKDYVLVGIKKIIMACQYG